MSVSTSAEHEELNQLLQQTGREDQQAFAELYKRTSSKLFGVCLRMLRDRSEAEEVLQETYTTVWRRAGSFDAAKASAIAGVKRRRSRPPCGKSLTEMLDANPMNWKAVVKSLMERSELLL